MSLGFLRFLSHQSSRVCFPITLKPSTNASWYWQLCTSFSSDVESGNFPIQTVAQKKPKKIDPRARVTFSSVGRKINHRLLNLFGDDGEDLGVKHRADVIRLMDQTGLKLVAVNENCDPPVYKLIKGKEIHEEQLKLREQQKTRKGLIQSKELNFSSDISAHDLEIKLRQTARWLENKHHVKLLIKARTISSTPLDKILAEMVEKISVPASFVSNPTVTKGGRAAMCLLRPASAKEQQKKSGDLSKKTVKLDSAKVQTNSGVPDESKDVKQQ